MNYFEYNGVKSSDMGLRIEKKNVFSAPKYDVKFQEIPGRNGDLILPNGRYPNVQITYTVFLPAKTTQELADKITAVKGWLYAGQNSYHTLKDTYDTTFFRKAVFANKLDIDDELGKIGTFTVSFSCQPFRYTEAGQQEFTATKGANIVNPYPFTSRPLFKITTGSTGTGTLTVVTPSGICNLTINGVSGTFYIDSELMNCYKNNASINDKITGSSFPVFEAGTNVIVWTGSITSVKVTPRWCSL